MPYSETWDEAFPPDTQAANLLGDDIRTFKTAIRERVQSFGAGPLGSRPTPEAVWVGVMYFATDTGQVFVWDGAAWNEVTSDFFSSVLLADYTSHVHTGTITEDTIYSTTLKANSLGTTHGVRIKIFGVVTTQQLSPSTIFLRVGGVLFTNLSLTNANTGVFNLEIIFGNRGSAASQETVGWIKFVNTNAPAAQTVSTTLNTALDQPLAITVLNGNVADSQTFLTCQVEIV